MHRSCPAWRLALAVLLLGGLLSPLPTRAAGGDDAAGASSYGDTYTAAELAGLDRALHAANMTREDLRFRKDMRKGYQCLDVVRRMMDDPLLIPVVMDAFVAGMEARSPDAGSAAAAVAQAAGWLGDGPPLPAGDAPAPLRETTPAALLDRLVELLVPGDAEAALETAIPEENLPLLRQCLPGEMDWHDVFASPYLPAVAEMLKKEREVRGDAWLHETASRIDVRALAADWLRRFGRLPAWLAALPPECFPKNAPLVRETPYGRVALGTPGNDRYEGDYALLVDPGGNDRYEHCRIGAASGTEGRRVGLFADLGGDDVYECSDVDLTLGAAVLGVAAFFDLGAGNDRYLGGHGTMGAAMGGVAVLYDDGGTDVYEGKTFTQGAAGFGIGILLDDSVQPAPTMTTDEGTKDPVDVRLFDNDRLSAWANAQAFARCRSVALCINRRGNDIYEAGGVYLDAPLFADRYQSFSQGFAIGERSIDYAGGVALVIDLAGNDRYLGDIYDQGVGYWYSAGLLYDGGGNDTYEMTQYGQGSGIHLAVGGLVDVAGHDTYVMHSGLGQGGSHDYAASVLHDRGGNDHYLGMTSCNGTGLTNAVGIQIDRSGNDTYAGRRDGGVNFGRPARGFSSIGVLVDVAGADDYLGIMKDGEAWRQSDIGVGVDVPDTAGAAETQAPDHVTGQAEIPAVCHTEAPLDQEIFDELWAIAVRWEVGDNRVIVPEARKRLVAYGAEILPYLDAKMEKDESGLELRAYVDILGGLRDAGAAAGVTDLLRRNLRAEGERRPTVALYLVSELKPAGLDGEVVALLGGKDDGLARRAAAALRAIGSHAGDAVLLGWLDPAGDERKIQAALGTLLGLETACYDSVRPLLDHPLLSVRTLLAALLAEHAMAYGPRIRADIAAADLSVRARRTLLDALARTDAPPAPEDVERAIRLLAHEDWGMRADAARVLRHWEGLAGTDAVAIAPGILALDRLLETEPDPYVRFWAGRP